MKKLLLFISFVFVMQVNAQTCYNLNPATNYSVGSSPYSLATADFNSDGNIDIVTANHNAKSVSVLLGNGTGTFSAPTDFHADSIPYFVITDDFNNDTKIDIAVVSVVGSYGSVLLGTGTGSFGAPINFTVGTNPESLISADFNNDGNKDVAVTNSGSNNVSVLLGTGTGSFGAAVNYTAGSYPQSIISADFNNDSKADLAVANFSSNSVSMLLGNGSGGFANAVNFGVGTNPFSVISGDFNNDGKPDLATANRGSSNASVLINNGTGGFYGAVNYTAGANPWSITAADFDANGKTDIAVANENSNTVSVFSGTGTGTFGPATNYPVGTAPFAVCGSDFNNDGKTDLATANEGVSTVSILLYGPQYVGITGNMSICKGNGAALTASGLATYTWSANAGSAQTAAVTIYPTVTTSYTVSGANGVGCASTATIAVTVSQMPTVTVTGNLNICYGQSTTLHAHGAASYNWSNGGFGPLSTADSIVVTPTASVTSLGLQGITGACYGSNNTITVNTSNVISTNFPSRTICNGSSTALKASGSTSYTWMPGGATTSSITVNPASTTIYTVTGKTNSCIFSTYDTVMVITCNTPTTCVDYDFSNGHFTGWVGKYNTDVSFDNSGSYDPVTNYGLLNTTGIDSSGKDLMNNLAHEICDIGSDTYISTLNRIAVGHNLSVRLGSDRADYGHQTLTKTYAITAANNVFGYWFAFVTNGSNAHPANSEPYFQVKFYDAGNNEITSARKYFGGTTNAASLISYSASSVYYQDWVYASANLTAYVGQNVKVVFETADCNAGGHFGYAYIDVDCGVPSVQITQSASQPCPTEVLSVPSGYASYAWYGPGIIGATNTDSVTVNAAGTYSVILVDGGGVHDTLTTVVAQPGAKPVVSFSANQACFSTATTFTNQTTNAPTSYAWYFGDATTSTAQNPTHTYTTSGTHSVTLIAGNGCGTDTLIQTITVLASPTITIIAPDTVCNAATSTSLTASGASTYTWSAGALVGSGATGATLYDTWGGGYISTFPAGIHTYTVTGTDANGCTNTATHAINFYHPNVTVTSQHTFTNSATVCKGVTDILTAQGAYTYTWQYPQSANTASLSVTYINNNNQFTVVGYGNLGCPDTVWFTIYATQPPAVSITASHPTICAGLPDTLSASGANTYTWSTTETTATITPSPTVTTTYTVIGANANGCTNTDTTTITVISAPTMTVTNPPPYCPGDLIPSPTISTNPGTAVTFSYTTSNVTIGMPAFGTGVPMPYTAPANATQADIVSIITYTPSLNGCVGPVATETLIIKATPFVQSIANQYVCSGAYTNPVQLSTLPASANATFNWTITFNNGIQLANSTNPIPGIQVTNPDSITTQNPVVVTPILNGCVGPDSSFTIFIYPALTATYTMVQDTAPHTWDLYPTFTGGTAPYTYSWNWGDGSTSTSAYPSHVYSTPGSYSICVTLTDANNCSVTYCQNDSVYRLPYSTSSTMVYVNVLHGNQTTGITSFNAQTSTIQIYPNPAQNNFTVEVSNNEKQTLSIFDINGKQVLSQTINGTTIIDASNLSQGVYNISISSNASVVNKKLIIVK